MKAPVTASLLALLLSPPAAFAQTDPVEERLRRGVDLRRAGHEDEARAEFEAAYGLRREPRTAAQLGLACQAGGEWVRADALLREALAAPTDAWITRNRAALEGARAMAERHLATVHLVGDVAGARVRVNGADAGALPLAAPLRVLAGSVTLELSAEGHEPLTLRFVTAAGETLRERATLRPIPPAAPPPPPPPPPPVVTRPPPVVVAPPVVTPRPAASPWLVPAVGAFAGAAVFVVAGVTALALREGSASDYNRQCDAGDASGDCGVLRDRTVGLGTAGWVMLPVGALLAVAGVVFVTRGAPSRATSQATCGAGAASVHCAFTF